MKKILKFIAAAALVLAAGVDVQANDLNRKPLDCLAQNIYFEAGNQTPEGMVAVGFVTLNRVASKSFPNTICKVVWQRKQFSWTHDGKSDKLKDINGRDMAYAVAMGVMLGLMADPTNGAINYHATYINPPVWTTRLKLSAVIQKDGIGHVFYKN